MKRLYQMMVVGMSISTLFFTSCSSDDDNTSTQISGNFAQGVLILNEGNMGNANASVSFLGNDGVLQPAIFQAVNGQLLGDTAQSIYVEEDKAYMVIYGSGTIEVVNRYTFEKLGTITSGLVGPRYIVVENGKGYVSNWGDPLNTSDDFIAVVNLSNYTVETTISVAEGPERMEEANGKVFVAHAGGWGTGNTISVINTANNSLSTSITVGDIPNSIEEENGLLYVLCGGKPAWTQDETLGGLYVINTSQNAIVSQFDFNSGEHPSQLVEEDGQLFYTIDNKIYTANLGLNSLPTSPLFTLGAQGVYGVYGFDVNDGKVYVGDAMDYTSNGKVYVYTTSGTWIESHIVGKLPNGFAFNDSFL